MHFIYPELGLMGANGIVGAQVPQAAGMALASALRKDNHVAITFFGEGAIYQGVMHETFNIAQKWKLPFIFYCENNRYSEMTPIASTSSVENIYMFVRAYGMESLQIDGNDVEAVYQGVSEAAERARAGEGPTFIEGITYRLAGHMAGDLETYRSPEEIESQRQHEPLQVVFNRLCRTRHLQGRSAAPARRGRAGGRRRCGICHEQPLARPGRGVHRRICRVRDTMRKTTYIQAINEAMREEMRRDESVFIIGEDVGHYGGLFRVTRNLFDEFGPQRVIDTPISEQAFMGMALGAATVGMRPIVELMYMDFFLVAADQIFNQIAKMHYMSGGQVTVPLVIRGQQGGGKRYGSQHSQSVESVFAHFPGIKVVAPATPYDAKGLLVAAIRDNNPVCFLEHKMLYFTRGDVPPAGEEYTVPIGKADVKREGKDLTIATFSYCMLQALEAADELAQRAGHRVRGG